MIYEIAKSSDANDIYHSYRDYKGEEYGFQSDIAMQSIAQCLVYGTVIKMHDDEIRGFIAGYEQKSIISDHVYFVSVLFYIQESHRKHTKEFLTNIKNTLKPKIDRLILASPTDKLNRYYEMLGGKKLETHYYFNL